MTVLRLSGVGLCARLDQVGDWAFELALDLARRHDVVLDIFFFPDQCGEAHSPRGRRGELSTMSEKEAIEIERNVRLYYDERLGDFLNVGFRLCEGDEEPELRRCLLMRREYDVLVLPYPDFGLRFAGRPIEEFVQGMPCPTILVGPNRKDQLYVNTSAHLWMDRLGFEDSAWEELGSDTVSAGNSLSVS